ncbi:MAG: penicillin amidase [Cyanobacteria bacterium M_surface_10_m2_119]|nr:penicillin amidase [Cyanobacteria bacterium K_DeepCast_35m_m2_023]MBM5825315.1 penicillin amidase [Cyanobacteria bacterium M_surface_10_m2_119]
MALRLPAPSLSGTPVRSGGWLLPLALLVSLTGALPARAQAQEQDAASKGAQIYCFMRNSGNSHQVSWDAAYAVIKRQTDRLFKTSPQHAAVMITEAVVKNPAEFPDCGRYLGDLFRQPESSGTSPSSGSGQTSAPAGGTTRNDRYGY